jgi:hypothetical protein
MSHLIFGMETQSFRAGRKSRLRVIVLFALRESVTSWQHGGRVTRDAVLSLVPSSTKNGKCAHTDVSRRNSLREQSKNPGLRLR